MVNFKVDLFNVIEVTSDEFIFTSKVVVLEPACTVIVAEPAETPVITPFLIIVLTLFVFDTLWAITLSFIVATAVLLLVHVIGWYKSPVAFTIAVIESV